SGAWDSTYEVHGHDAAHEPHHQVIKESGQVQIYELVMGDANYGVTTTLLRAVHRLKDNRLPPVGYSTAHPSQDTSAIAGLALADPDFNHDALGNEGSGGDVVHYHIPLHGYDGAVEVKAKVWFQQVPPRWNQEMFSHQGPQIDAFRDMYLQADRTPELVVADSLVDVGTSIAERPHAVPVLFPNPTRDGALFIAGPGVERIRAYDAAGRQVTVKAVRLAEGWRC